MAKKKIVFKAVLADRSAITFDSGGSAKVKLEADEQQTAEVATLLLGSGKMLTVTVEFDDAPEDD